MKNLYLNGLVKEVDKRIVNVASVDMVKEEYYDVAQYHRGSIQIGIVEAVPKTVKITIEATVEYLDSQNKVIPIEDAPALTGYVDVTKTMFGVDFVDADTILNDISGILMGFGFIRIKIANQFYSGAYSDSVVTLNSLFSS
jgi:hypothetical protein